MLRNVDFVYQHQGVTLVPPLMVLFDMLEKRVDALKLNVHVPQGRTWSVMHPVFLREQYSKVENRSL